MPLTRVQLPIRHILWFLICTFQNIFNNSKKRASFCINDSRIVHFQDNPLSFQEGRGVMARSVVCGLIRIDTFILELIFEK